MRDAILFCALSLVASAVGTATGFGTSTLMMPVMVMFVSMPVALLFVGVIHLFGDLWKVLLFRSGARWRLVLGFGIPGVAASYLGAALSLGAEGLPMKRILGAFLVLYMAFLFLRKEWALPKGDLTSISGGTLSGLFAGFFGVGGAVRAAFLTAFDLPKEVYVFTSGLIALFIDITRVARYISGGTDLGSGLAAALAFAIPFSFAGSWLARRFLAGVPQRYFRIFVGVFLGLTGMVFILRG